MQQDDCNTGCKEIKTVGRFKIAYCRTKVPKNPSNAGLGMIAVGPVAIAIVLAWIIFFGKGTAEELLIMVLTFFFGMVFLVFSMGIVLSGTVPGYSVCLKGLNNGISHLTFPQTSPENDRKQMENAVANLENIARQRNAACDARESADNELVKGL